MKSLSEIMGAFIRPAGTTQVYSQSPGFVNNPLPPDADIRVVGPKVRNCATLEAWQRDIVENLNQGIDQYIIARPGGGKTLPIICYWTNSLLGLNTMKLFNNNVKRDVIRSLFTFQNRENIPKILILVPVISLAQQTAMELRTDLASVLLQIYNNAPEFYLDNYLKSYEPTRFHIVSFLNQVATIKAELDRVQLLPQNSREKSSIRDLQQALSSANKSLVSEVERCISDMVNRMIYMKIGGSNQQTRLEDALVYVSIYESAPSFVKKIQNLKLVVIDEAHLIQQSGNIYDDDSRAYQICSGLFDVLKTLKHNSSCRLALLSGTINPTSAASITKYFNHCFKRNFPSQPTLAPPEAANRSTLTIIRNESIRTQDGIINNILKSIKQRDWGQLYVIFSANKINQIVKECIEKTGVKNIESMTPGGYEPDQTFKDLNNNTSLRSSSSPDRLGVPPGTHLQVANITNPLLRQAVLRGIGFIYRNIPGDSSGNKLEMNNSDKVIVAKLFKERKLNVLLATDAVGIGVNIDVKDLYIPDTSKYSDKVKQNIPVALRDLSQIINRAGRGATPIASIQTPESSIEMITNAIYSNPEDLPNVDAILGLNNLCSLTFFIKFMSRLSKYF